MFLTVQDIFTELVRNSPGFNKLVQVTTQSRRIVLDLLVWFDGAKPKVSCQLRLIDIRRILFYLGYSDPHELLGFIGTEYDLLKVCFPRF